MPTLWKLTYFTYADLIRSISDPEHLNMSLEELLVVSAPQVAILNNNVIDVEFTPTVPHCGASTLIGTSLSTYLHRRVCIRG
jgi:hypothetical protein